MDSYSVVADMMMGCGFFGIAMMAAYRVIKQGVAEPELRHLSPVMVSCVVAGIGCVTRDVFPETAILGGVGMLGVAWSLGCAVRPLLAQPTLSDVREVVSRVEVVEDKLAEVLRGSGSR
jgi:hypothetical protein